MALDAPRTGSRGQLGAVDQVKTARHALAARSVRAGGGFVGINGVHTRNVKGRGEPDATNLRT